MAFSVHTVFLADDEAWVLIGLKKLIEKTGLPFRVIGEAYNGVTTLEEIEKKKPDVLITDIRMPGYSGLELMEKINVKQLSIKVVFLSGFAQFSYAQSACRMGAFDYLVKPVDLSELSDVLSRLQKSLLPALDAGICSPEDDAEVYPSIIKQIVGEIRQSYTEDISLTGLSRKYAISTGLLSQKLKNELGLSFVDYVACMRVQRAKELLADEKLSIDDVAKLVGYKDYFYFTKVFKKISGISPSKYRK